MEKPLMHAIYEKQGNDYSIIAVCGRRIRALQLLGGLRKTFSELEKKDFRKRFSFRKIYEDEFTLKDGIINYKGIKYPLNPDQVQIDDEIIAIDYSGTVG